MNVEMEFERALHLLDSGDHLGAEKIFLELEQIAPELIGIKMNLANIEESKGDIPKAIQYLEAALAIAPNHPMIVRSLAELSNDPKYLDMQASSNRVIELTSEAYYEAYQANLPIINEDYINFDLCITGQIVAIDREEEIIYLKGGAATIEESVACLQVGMLLDSAKLGEEISIIGGSFGKGPDSQNPIIIMHD
jgi:tetratricopeptide (TPR) repeat protein